MARVTVETRRPTRWLTYYWVPLSPGLVVGNELPRRVFSKLQGMAPLPSFVSPSTAAHYSDEATAMAAMRRAYAACNEC